MYASLSHSHYWYEAGMLKVPASTVARLVHKTTTVTTQSPDKIAFKHIKKGPVPKQHIFFWHKNSRALLGKIITVKYSGIFRGNW